MNPIPSIVLAGLLAAAALSAHAAPGSIDDACPNLKASLQERLQPTQQRVGQSGFVAVQFEVEDTKVVRAVASGTSRRYEQHVLHALRDTVCSKAERAGPFVLNVQFVDG